MANYKETGIGTDDSTDLSKFPLDDVDKVALKAMLQERLKECGWSKSVQQRIRNILTERGVKNVTHAQLAAEIMPQARALVPEGLRKEMVIRMREALENKVTH